MKKYFLTFASSDLSKSLDRISDQAKKMKIYDDIFVLNENDLDLSFRNRHSEYLKKGIRGFGYWCWKPQVILQTLDRMDYGDLLQYTDAGCHLNANGIARLSEYFNLTSKTNNGILAFQSKIIDGRLKYDGRSLPDLCDYKWIKGDLLDYFNVRDDNSILKTQTIGAGIIFIKKCAESVKIIKEWLSTIESDFRLIDDSPSVNPNLPDFIEHRHDQAIFSIICKLNNVHTLSAYEYWYPSIDSMKPDWKSLEDFPIHAKRDKSFSFRSSIINLFNKVKRRLKKITTKVR